MNRYLVCVLLLAAGVPEVAAQRAFDRTNLRVLYTSSLLRYRQKPDIDQLEQLLDGGMNTIVVGIRTSTELEPLITKIRSNPTLSRYRYFISIIGPVYDAYGWCQGNPALCNPSTPLPEKARNILDEVTRVAMDNSDIVVGYYTFDV